MKVVSQRDSFWFLLKDGERFFLDVNSGSSFVGYSITIELEATELENFDEEGDRFIDQLADQINDQQGPFLEREKDLEEATLTQIHEAIMAWKDQGKASLATLKQPARNSGKAAFDWRLATGYSLVVIAIIVAGFVFYGTRENDHFLKHGVKHEATVIRKSADLRVKNSESRYFLHVIFNASSVVESPSDLSKPFPDFRKIKMVSADVPVTQERHDELSKGDRVKILALPDKDPVEARLADALASASYTGGYVLIVLLAVGGAALIFVATNRAKAGRS